MQLPAVAQGQRLPIERGRLQHEQHQALISGNSPKGSEGADLPFSGIGVALWARWTDQGGDNADVAGC